MTNLENGHMPKHLAFILDGNRRWAAAHGLTAAEGHEQGYQNLKTIVQAAQSYHVQYISAYIFSSENWQRNATEVKNLMRIIPKMLLLEVNWVNQLNIRVKVIGS